MDGNDNTSVIARRRMIRRYTQQEVEATVVEALLQAAVQAPSPHNRQPWRFAVLRGSTRDQLATVMGNQLRSDLMRDGISSEVVEQDTSRSFQRIISAPVSILVCLTMKDMDRYPDERRMQAEHTMALQAISAGIQNILLRATELGLGACWMCAPLFCQKQVSQALHLEPDWEPQALITLGYPADLGKARVRRSINEVAVYIGATDAVTSP